MPTAPGRRPRTCRSSRRAPRTSPRPRSSRATARSVTVRDDEVAGVPVRVYEPRTRAARSRTCTAAAGSRQPRLRRRRLPALAIDAGATRGQHRLPARARAPVPGAAGGRARASCRALERPASRSPATGGRQPRRRRARRRAARRRFPAADLPGRPTRALNTPSYAEFGEVRPDRGRHAALLGPLPRRRRRPPDASPLRATDLAAPAGLRDHRRATTSCATRARPTRPRSSARASRSAAPPDGTIHGFWRWQTTQIARAPSVREAAQRCAQR